MTANILDLDPWHYGTDDDMEDDRLDSAGLRRCSDCRLTFYPTTVAGRTCPDCLRALYDLEVGDGDDA